MLKDLMPEEPAPGVNPASSGNGLLPTRPLFCVSKKEFRFSRKSVIWKI